jgi:hypothetical protein
MRVRSGSKYTYDPVALDEIIDPPYGAVAGILKKGDVVRVKNLPGCPSANTMGMAHIVSEDGTEFLGLVSTCSLIR